MITYNNIVTKFEEFVTAHLFLQTFSHGSPSDVDLDKFETYPLLHLVYVGGGYVNNVKTYNLEIYILDNPVREADKTDYQKSVISGTEQVAEDILADIENGGNIFQFGYHYEIQSANIVPLEDMRSNILAGTLLTLSIGVAYQYDSCNAPITGVEPEGSTPPMYAARGLLRVREEDGSPDVLSVATINVPNGSLTDDGEGEITLDFATGATDSSRVIVTAKNKSGGTLAKGTPVHAITPVSAGQLVEVIAARADTPSAMPATLVLNEELANEAEGEAIVVGFIQNVDTSAFAAGDVIYVGPTGGYTNTKPTGTNLIQNLGVVVRSHASAGSGIVYGSGRSNDVPNLADGKFFIGSTGNTQESAYGLPTTDPSDNDGLVFDAASDAFVAGHPIATGQQSTFVATSTESTTYGTTTGNKTIEFGSYLANNVVFTQNCRAGFNMGMNVSGVQFLAQPIGIGSTFTIELTVEAKAPAGTIGQLGTTATGWLAEPPTTSAFIGDGTWQTLTLTISAQVSFWQLSNTAQYYMNVVVSGGVLYMRNPVFELTINHA